MLNWVFHGEVDYREWYGTLHEMPVGGLLLVSGCTSLPFDWFFKSWIKDKFAWKTNILNLKENSVYIVYIVYICGIKHSGLLLQPLHFAWYFWNISQAHLWNSDHDIWFWHSRLRGWAPIETCSLFQIFSGEEKWVTEGEKNHLILIYFSFC